MPEKFENSIFILKIHQMFSIHTVEKCEIATITSGCQSCWILCLWKTQEDKSHNYCGFILEHFLFCNNVFMSCLHSVKLVLATSGLKSVFEKFNFVIEYVDSTSTVETKLCFQIFQV